MTAKADKMKIRKILSSVVLSVSAVLIGTSTGSIVQAADIGYQRSTSWTDPIFNKGEVKALVVRVGYEDYSLDESNSYYRNDLYMRKLFEGGDGGVTSYDQTWDGLDGYLRTSSYGQMSLKIGDIIDVQLDKDIGSFFEDEEFFEDPESLEATSPWCDFFQEDLKKMIYSKINISDYDEDADGDVDALYIFNCAPQRGVSADIAGFVTDIKGNNLHGGVNSYMYMSFMDEQTPFEEEQLFLTLVHETGHLLFGLDDYYNLEGFSYETVGPGNIMDQNLADIDGYSKYLIGWLDDENILNCDPASEKSFKVSLTASDAGTSEGKKLAFFDYGSGKIVVEYISSANNNKTGTKAGYRFYLVGSDGNMSQAYYFEDEEGFPSQVVGEGEEVHDIFGLGLDIYDVKTGDDPSFSFSSAINAYDESEILRIDLNDKEGEYGKVRLIDPRSEVDGIKFIIIKDGHKTQLVYLNSLYNRIDNEIFNSTDIHNVLRTDMEYITDGGFLDSSGRIINTKEIYEGGETLHLDSEDDFFEIFDSNDIRLGFKIIDKDQDEVRLIYKYPADEEWIRNKDPDTEPVEGDNDNNKNEQTAENDDSEKDNEIQSGKKTDISPGNDTGSINEKTPSQDTDQETKESLRKGSFAEKMTPTSVLSAGTGDADNGLLYYMIAAASSVSVLGIVIRCLKKQK